MKSRPLPTATVRTVGLALRDVNAAFSAVKVHGVARVQPVRVPVLPVRNQPPLRVASRNGLQLFVTGDGPGSHTSVEYSSVAFRFGSISNLMFGMFLGPP